jgi:PHD/YefM family antitoxin component YafN of YafNO toxin-antitoxin module
MTDPVATPYEPERYARFPSKTSKDARENLPQLVDDVVDRGEPVVIKKLNVGRAALIPARDLWMYELVELLDLDRRIVDKPAYELMRQVFERSKHYLETHPEGVDDSGKAGSTK